MSGKQFFEIPDDLELMTKLVEVIPSSWAWVDGILKAPRELIESGKALADTGFAIQRFHSIGPTIRGLWQEGKEQQADLYGIIAERKLPGFVRFDEAGYESDISLELAKKIAIAYLRMGYRGSLFFYRDCCNNSKYNNPERYSLFLQKWHENIGVLGTVRIDYPPAIVMEWNEKYGGKPENLKPIVSLCRSFNLREFTPELVT